MLKINCLSPKLIIVSLFSLPVSRKSKIIVRYLVNLNHKSLETKEITLYLFFSGLTLVVRKSFLVSLWMFSIYNEVMLLATCPRIKGK